MKFITIRDLRNKPAQIQKELPEEKEMILTSNGKPIAILSLVTDKTLEETLFTMRRVRAISAVSHMQEQSLKSKNNRMKIEEINKEITEERKKRFNK